MILSPPAIAGDRPFVPAFPYLPPAASAVMGLGSRDCRWPLGEIGDADFGFCGGARLPRGSYCAVHARIAGAGAFGRGGRA